MGLPPTPCNELPTAHANHRRPVFKRIFEDLFSPFFFQNTLSFQHVIAHCPSCGKRSRLIFCARSLGLCRCSTGSCLLFDCSMLLR